MIILNIKKQNGIKRKLFGSWYKKKLEQHFLKKSTTVTDFELEFVKEFGRHFLKKSNIVTDFDKATSLLSKVFLVTLDKSNWTLSFCTCYYFHKLYMCSYILAVAIHQKLARIPQNVVEMQKISERPGPGRKKLVGPALSKE